MLGRHAGVSVEVEKAEVVRGRNQSHVLAHINRVDMGAVLTEGPDTLNIPALLDLVRGPKGVPGVIEAIAIKDHCSLSVFLDLEVKFFVSTANRSNI